MVLPDVTSWHEDEGRLRLRLVLMQAREPRQPVRPAAVAHERGKPLSNSPMKGQGRAPPPQTPPPQGKGKPLPWTLPWGKGTVPSSLSPDPYPSPQRHPFDKDFALCLIFQGVQRVATWQLSARITYPAPSEFLSLDPTNRVKVLLTLFSLPTIATRSILAYDLFANFGEFS